MTLVMRTGNQRLMNQEEVYGALKAHVRNNPERGYSESEVDS